MFQQPSRYYVIERAEWTAADARIIPYVRRRFIPRERPLVLTRHTVTAGDRIDNIAARHLGSPEQFWRLCDANAAMRPDELTDKINRVLIIPLPHPR